MSEHMHLSVGVNEQTAAHLAAMQARRGFDAGQTIERAVAFYRTLHDEVRDKGKTLMLVDETHQAAKVEIL